jgi:murein DD-endopeptidase MepM/ murein hydrolase activator NlpD
MWPGFWTDANPFGNWYGDSGGNGAFHTGADLNLNIPRFNLDRGASVHSVASGIVVWAGWRGSVWRNIIIIEHDPLADGSKVFARYAHVENIQVAVGQRVARGQQIAVVGMSGGVGPNYHLHFDLSHTDVLKQNPGHWPGSNITELFAHYIDPKGFIERRRPKV